ncbi:exocyst complex component SEC3A-like isoform X2 [Hibiscus syriacus]|uniref:exocyst complex component SEC3A-like isoform X2 n=1 Tax=Hibiscus syriacus TaxID=106335 RepID=UPI0019228E61|nr:exocyst complex component SEC3A-like isoform X2 [Hibiscus syriacus]
MAKSSADDAELRRACDAAIEGTKQKVLLSMRVVKSQGIWSKSGVSNVTSKLNPIPMAMSMGMGGGQKNMAKPRVIAICTKKRGQRTKAFLRVMKYSSGGVIEAAELYKLKHLSKVEVCSSDPSGCTFTLGFDNLRSQSVALSPPQWTMRYCDDRNRLLVCILNICRDLLGRIPKVVGIDVVEMALWAKLCHGHL